jgi:GxxExxY protein
VSCAGLRLAYPAGMELSNEQLTFEVIQAAKTVHTKLGPGFVEPVYNKAFGLELRNRGLNAEREKLIRVLYSSIVVGRHYLDLVVENRAIIELKASRAIIPLFEAQMRSYLAASPYSFGLIINFGTQELEWKEVFGCKNVL